VITKPKRPKKTDRQKLIKELDKLSKKLVYLRDDYTCQWCGKRDGSDYQASHVIPVSAGMKMRWDVENMKVLCYHCHLNIWHKNPLKASEWFNNKFPERARYLEANRGIIKFTLSEMEEMRDSYKEKIADLTP
jgi:5-methylcytosine-specific restriction endonuclease McrA